MSVDGLPIDPITELRYALAESDSSAVPAGQRDRILAAVTSGRAPGYAIGPSAGTTGPEIFRRVTSRLDNLLSELTVDEWHARTVRGLDVQQLVGHLIGVEDGFAAVVAGSDDPAVHGEANHIESTQAVALEQSGRLPSDTRQDWLAAVGRTLDLAGDGRDLSRAVRFHRMGFDIEALLVVRTFEIWTHDEDIRRAVGRPMLDPDGATLDRMTDLAASLLPAGVSIVSGAGKGTARLVLTGPGGGAWDVNLGGVAQRAASRGRFDAHVTVDAAAFCRVVANRSDLAGSKATVRGDDDVASLLFAGAAALALD